MNHPVVSRIAYLRSIIGATQYLCHFSLSRCRKRRCQHIYVINQNQGIWPKIAKRHVQKCNSILDDQNLYHLHVLSVQLPLITL